MKKELIKNELLKLGFKPNNKSINGFKPHFINEKEEVVFLMGKDFWISKISDINTAFKDYGKNIFGILLDDSPRVADKDWVTHENTTLIKVSPLLKGQWDSNGNDIEYVPFAFC
jgi:hypothetical protein